MNFSPSLPEFLKGTDAYDLIGIQAEFSADTETPLSAYAKLADQKPAFLFESVVGGCLLYTSPSPRDRQKSRMPSSA